jgi:uncharacterized membrane protein YfcA
VNNVSIIVLAGVLCIYAGVAKFGSRNRRQAALFFMLGCLCIGIFFYMLHSWNEVMLRVWRMHEPSTSPASRE